jgi:two-component system OmpR family sensor kinase
LTPDTRREPLTLTDPSVDGVCEDASDAGGTVTDSGARGTTILARPLALRRAISNLIDNAIKYGGGAAVGVAVHASDRNC